MFVSVYDRCSDRVFMTAQQNAQDIIARSGLRYGLGTACPPEEQMTEAEWLAKAGLPPEAPSGEPDLRVMAGEALPMPKADFNGADPAKFDHDGDGAPGGSLSAGDVIREAEVALVARQAAEADHPPPPVVPAPVPKPVARVKK